MIATASPIEVQLRRLLNKLSDVQSRADERAKATHGRFNVFSTLLKDDDEVRLHTRFIHCLLNPKGCHDCDSLFLGLFFDTLAEFPCEDHANKPAQIDIPRSEKQWEVRKEFRCPRHGQIDILIETCRFGIAIENKINAAEQPLQLGCYANYLGEKHGDAARLIYLTKDGKASTSHDGASYIRISYSKHILAWLDKCLRETFHIIPMNQVLLQYRSVVLKLTGKNLDDASMKEISEFITKNPDIIRFTTQILEGIEKARVSILDHLGGEIQHELQKHGFSASPLRTNSERWFGETLGGLVISTPPGSDLRDAPFKIWVQNADEYLAVGIVTESWHFQFTSTLSDKSKCLVDPLIFVRMIDLLGKTKLEGYDRGQHPGWPTGRYNLIKVDDQAIAALSDTKTMAETVLSGCEKIVDYIVQLEKPTKWPIWK